MAELGIDISAQESKTLEGYLHQPFDKVITVCDQAKERCQVFFGAKERIHWSFPDPNTASGIEAQQPRSFAPSVTQSGHGSSRS
jgi:arsenate reductase